MKYVISIDQGTTSSRAILFDENMNVAAISQKEFTQHFPHSGWVEHNVNEIWDTVLDTCNDVIAQKKVAADDIAAIGITNQRETTVVWDKLTGKPIYNAIVWQDRRTASHCETLKNSGVEEEFSAKTGLLLDPYFSGTKIAWVLNNVDGAREKALNGDLLFGTIDCYLVWKLTEGRVHATDATNASRTLLYNIQDGCWDKELCRILNVPMNMLPEVKNSADDFGDTSLFGGTINIRGVAGDQQAATIGQACFKPGMMKSTYGTGCFALFNTGDELIHSKNRLLTTIAYQFDGKPTYALEGSIFIAGAVVQWLRDGLKIINHASDTATLAQNADENHRLYMVPAFTGLGAPYWDAECRGAIYGLTRNSGPEEFARAALESVAYQSRDLLEAMKRDINHDITTTLRVDGGMASSDWTMQYLSDILNAEVHRPHITETTALGAAWLAGMAVGLYPQMDEFAKNWQLEQSFTPSLNPEIRENHYKGWLDAVERTLSR